MLGLELRIIIKNIHKVCRMKIESLNNSIPTKFEVIGVRSNYIGKGYK